MNQINNNQNNQNNNIVINNKPQIKIYPSKLHKDNKGALDWSWQNLIAYGCHSHIVIIDPFHLQILQTLDEHRYFVSIVKWSNDISPSKSSILFNNNSSSSNNTSSNNNSSSPPQPSSNSNSNNNSNNNNNNNLIRLASADINGHIIIWNVLDANVLLYLPNSESSTQQPSSSSSSSSSSNSKSTPPTQSSMIFDLCWHPDDPDLLLSLHCGYLCLWNVSTGINIWKRDIPDGFYGYSIQFDPFKSNRIFLSTSFGCIYQIDDLSIHQLPLLEFKYRIFSKNNHPILNNDLQQLTNQWLSINSSSNNNNSNSNTGSNTNSSNSSNTSSSNLLNTPNNTSNKEITSIDFLQMKFSPYSKNLIYYLLHRELFIYDSNTNQLFGSLVLDRNKSNFVKILLSKDNANLMFSLHEDGSITSWNKRFIDSSNSGGTGGIYIFDQICISDLSHYQKKSKKKQSQSIFSIVNSPFFEQTCFTISGDGTCLKWDFISEITLNGSSNLYQPRLQPLSITPLNGVLRLAVSSFNETISSPNTSLSVYPFHNRSNISLIAIGTSHGTIQIVNMSTFKIQKEIYVWSHPIYGIRWLSPGRVLCFSYEEKEKGQYLNFITSVDFRSGRIKEFRKVSANEPTPIKGIRLSFSRKFLVILLKDRPFELWETKRFTLLRSFKPFVHIVGLEWLPPKDDSEVELSSDFSRYESKEQFTFLLQDATVKSCTIESNSVTLQDVHADLGPLQTSLASKRDFLVSGDFGGTIHVWSNSKKKLQTFSTHRGPIKKIRFSPNPNSFEILVLFISGEFGIWDLNLNQRVAVGTYILERDIKAIDFEWLTETTPIIVGSDNSLRVLDLSLSVTNSKFHFSSPLAQSIYNTSQVDQSSSSSMVVLNGNGGYLYSPILLPTVQWYQLKNLLLNYRCLLNSEKLIDLQQQQQSSNLNRSLDSSFLIKDNNEKNSKLLSLIDDKLLSILTPPEDINNSGEEKDEEEDSNNSSNLKSSSSFIYKSSNDGISLAESNLVVAQFFGNYKEMEFWRVAIASLSKYKNSAIDGSSISKRSFYDNDLIDYYESLPCLPSIPMLDGGTGNIQTNNNNNNNFGSSPSYTSLNSSSIIQNNNNITSTPTTSATTTTNTITPTLLSSQQPSVSPTIISSAPSSTNNTTTTSNVATNLLKKPLASFFGFGQKSQTPTSTPTPTTTTPTIPTSTSNTNITTTNTTINTTSNTTTPIISNIQSPNLGVSTMSPPTTPSKASNLLSSSSSSIFPLLSSQFSQSPHPLIQPPQSVQPQPPTIINPLSQSYSSVATQLNQSTIDFGISNSTESNTPLQLSNADYLNKTTNNQHHHHQHSNNNLPNYYDILLDSHNLRSLELERTDSYEKKKPDNELNKKLIEKNILLGRNARAVSLLLDTTPDHPDFFNRAMKACVISASISQEVYQNTTKLIADNLIAVGKLDEGVQFLCLIGKTMEACKYLQSCDRWYDAAILSKTNLSEDEHFVVFRAWIINLLSNSNIGLLNSNNNNNRQQQQQQQKPQNINQSINLLLSIGDFKSVIQILYETQQYDLASLLIDCCLENNIFTIPNLDDNDANNSENNDMSNSISIYSKNNNNNDNSSENNNGTTTTTNSLSNSTGISFKFNQLVQIIFKEYGNLLHQLGNDYAAEFYWRKAGRK